MRTFEKFPETAICPVCLTNENKECFLMPIMGTLKSFICEAIPTHVSCIDFDKFVYDKATNLIYLHGMGVK